MFCNIQSYIDYLDRRGELLRVEEYVNPDCGITEMTSSLIKSQGGKKAILFENTGKRFKVLTNIYGPDKALSYVFNATSMENLRNEVENFINVESNDSQMYGIRRLLTSRHSLKKTKFPPKVSKKVAHCQESVQYTAILSAIPFLTHKKEDSAPGIQDAIVFSNNPETGKMAIESIPVQILSDKTIAILADDSSILQRHIEKATHVLPLAICIGGNPILHFLARTDINADKLNLLGYLQKSRIIMTQCVTQDLIVPADSDFVIEGYIHKSSERTVAGPLLSADGILETYNNCPVMNVSCITHRNGAVLPAADNIHPWAGCSSFNKADEILLSVFAKKYLSPDIIRVVLPDKGYGQSIAIIKIKKLDSTKLKVIANRLWASPQFSKNRFMVFVGEDADVDDINQFAKYLAVHVNPDRDIYQTDGIINKNPSMCDGRNSEAKMMIDATNPATDHNNSFSDVFKIQFDDGIEDESQEEAISRKLRAIGLMVDIDKDCSISEHKLIIDARTQNK